MTPGCQVCTAVDARAVQCFNVSLGEMEIQTFFKSGQHLQIWSIYVSQKTNAKREYFPKRVGNSRKLVEKGSKQLNFENETF